MNLFNNKRIKSLEERCFSLEHKLKVVESELNKIKTPQKYFVGKKYKRDLMYKFNPDEMTVAEFIICDTVWTGYDWNYTGVILSSSRSAFNECKFTFYQRDFVDNKIFIRI